MKPGEGFGAQRVREGYCVEPSELGAMVADLLDTLFSGLYHIERPARRVDWANPYFISVTLPGALATYDFDMLTRLVFLCHDYCIRGDVEPAAHGYLRLVFHRRERAGKIYKRHPSLEQALATWRDRHEDMVPCAVAA